MRVVLQVAGEVSVRIGRSREIAGDRARRAGPARRRERHTDRRAKEVDTDLGRDDSAASQVKNCLAKVQLRMGRPGSETVPARVRRDSICTGLATLHPCPGSKP